MGDCSPGPLGAQWQEHQRAGKLHPHVSLFPSRDEPGCFSWSKMYLTSQTRTEVCNPSPNVPFCLRFLLQPWSRRYYSLPSAYSFSISLTSCLCLFRQRSHPQDCLVQERRHEYPGDPTLSRFCSHPLHGIGPFNGKETANVWVEAVPSIGGS